MFMIQNLLDDVTDLGAIQNSKICGNFKPKYTQFDIRETVNRLVKIIKTDHLKKNDPDDPAMIGGIQKSKNNDLVQSDKLNNRVISNLHIFEEFGGTGDSMSIFNQTQLNIQFKNDLDISIVIGPNVPQLIICDEQRITQVFVNLLARIL